MTSPVSTNLGSFGDSIAISGDTLVAGDPSDWEFGVGAGAVFVFRRSPDGAQDWRWTAKLHASDATHGMNFGLVVAVAGDILAVGSPLDSSLGLPYAGAVYVFERTEPGSDTWVQSAKLTASDPVREAQFGNVVVIEGDLLAVGAPYAKPVDKRSGAVYLFERESSASGVNWRETQRLFPRVAKDGLAFGSTLALSKDTLATGAPLDDASVIEGGAIYVYERRSPHWLLEAILTAPDAALQDGLGSIALTGRQLIAGAVGDNDQGPQSGSVYVFTRNESGWRFTQKLLQIEGEGGDNFGRDLAADKDLLIVTAPNSSALATDAGVAYAFRRTADYTWFQAGALMPSELKAQDSLGLACISDGIAVLELFSFPGGGRVHVFDTLLDRTASTYCSPSPAAWPECQPAIEAVGNATASGTSAFTLRAQQVPAGLFGFFAYTHSPTSLPIDGIAGSCLPGGALGRSQLLFSNGTFGSCDGSFELDWNDVLAAQAGADPALAQPGTYVYGQFAFFGFAAGGPMGFSDAVAFVTCP